MIITEESRDIMFRKKADPTGFYALGSSGVGLGVFLDNEAVFNSGEGSGSLSQVFFYPDDNDGFIIMTNDKTAWEFLYVSSAVLAMSMGHSIPMTSLNMIVFAVLIYGIMALMLTTILYKIHALYSVVNAGEVQMTLFYDQEPLEFRVSGHYTRHLDTHTQCSDKKPHVYPFQPNDLDFSRVFHCSCRKRIVNRETESRPHE